MTGDILDPDMQRFVEKVSPPNDRGCTLWKASCGRAGYGDFWLNGRTVAAHRTSWEFFCGPIPDGLCVLHKCDVRPCVNPEHLFLGTNRDNVDDMVAKGRHRGGGRSTAHLRGFDRRGEKSGRSKLTEAQASLILERHRSGDKPKNLAKEFGVAASTIRDLIRCDTWKHIDRAPGAVGDKFVRAS